MPALCGGLQLKRQQSWEFHLPSGVSYGDKTLIHAVPEPVIPLMVWDGTDMVLSLQLAVLTRPCTDTALCMQLTVPVLPGLVNG